MSIITRPANRDRGRWYTAVMVSVNVSTAFFAWQALPINAPANSLLYRDEHFASAELVLVVLLAVGSMNAVAHALRYFRPMIPTVKAAPSLAMAATAVIGMLASGFYY